MNIESNVGPEILSALSRFHGVVAMPKKENVNPHFRSRYADLATVLSAVLPALSECGLSVVQLPTVGERGVSLVTILGHASGQRIVAVTETSVVPKTPQELGSVLTYLRRYAVQSVLSLAADDDDGEAATAPVRATEKKSPPPPPPPAEKPKTEARNPALAERIRMLRMAIGWSTAQLGVAARDFGFTLSEATNDQLAVLERHLSDIRDANEVARGS